MSRLNRQVTGRKQFVSDEELREAILRDFNDCQIARAYGVTSQAVLRRRRQLGLEPGRAREDTKPGRHLARLRWQLNRLTLSTPGSGNCSYADASE